MKLSSRRFKFLGISILTLLIFIPLIVFGISKDSWSLSGNGVTSILDVSSLSRGKMCIQNSSTNTYFVPTKTDAEFSSFLAAVGRLGVSLPGSCCGDGICNGSETCATCGGVGGDCGACAVTCTAFYYTDWSLCDGTTKTRTIIASSPAGCVGGSPVTSQSCSCVVSGCINPATTCRNGTLYSSSPSCSGASTSLNNVCIDSATTPNYSCIGGGPSTSFVYTPSSGCTYTGTCLTHGPGCTAGNTCRDTKVHLNNNTCTDPEYGGGTQYNCMPNTTLDGCNSYDPDVSVYYTTVADSNCSH